MTVSVYISLGASLLTLVNIWKCMHMSQAANLVRNALQFIAGLRLNVTCNRHCHELYVVKRFSAGRNMFSINMLRHRFSESVLSCDDTSHWCMSEHYVCIRTKNLKL